MSENFGEMNDSPFALIRAVVSFRVDGFRAGYSEGVVDSKWLFTFGWDPPPPTKLATLNGFHPPNISSPFSTF